MYRSYSESAETLTILPPGLTGWGKMPYFTAFEVGQMMSDLPRVIVGEAIKPKILAGRSA